MWADRQLIGTHLNAGAGGAVTESELRPYIDAAEAYIEQRRPDLLPVLHAEPPTVPADVALACALVVARLWERRGSAAGLVGLDMGAAERVASRDPDLTRLLGIGVHAVPVVG